MFELSVHSSIREFERSSWDALLGDGPPYLEWTFLDVLEQTGCVRPERGWAPAHLSLSEAGRLRAVAPAYLKGNSEGEFVFDQSWAQFSSQRLNADYYPKLVVSCPFTPATGPRLLCAADPDPDALLQAFARSLSAFCDRASLSSAHVLFVERAQAFALERQGMALRFGLQFHWRNAGYSSFEDFLARYSSKRRNQIRRERRALLDQGVELVVRLGSELTPPEIDHVFAFYQSTVEKHLWGRQYLNSEFFHELCSRMGERVMVVFAWPKGSLRPIAGAFNLIGKRALYGRYWGAREELKYLHFNVCYYAGIEQCIARKLELFEPGAGGEHKLARGFEPVITYSVHHLRHPILDAAVRDFLERERTAIELELATEPHLLKPLPRGADSG